VLAVGCSSDGDGRPSAASTPPEGAEQDVVYTARSEDADSWHLERTTLPGGAASTIVTPEGDIADPDVSPAGSAIAYTATVEDQRAQLLVSPLEGDGSPTPIVTEDEWWCPRWLDDSTVLAVSPNGRRLGRIDVVTGDVEPAGTRLPSREFSCPDPSPDGTRMAVAVSTGRYEVNQLWVADIGSDQAHLLGAVPKKCIINGPAWAPTVRPSR
jgi:Tol biopolymer transport system component